MPIPDPHHAPPGSLWRHKKRGTTYRILRILATEKECDQMVFGRVMEAINATSGANDAAVDVHLGFVRGMPSLITNLPYQAELYVSLATGVLYCRDIHEFHDGRFEKVLFPTPLEPGAPATDAARCPVCDRPYSANVVQDGIANGCTDCANAHYTLREIMRSTDGRASTDELARFLYARGQALAREERGELTMRTPRPRTADSIDSEICGLAGCNVPRRVHGFMGVNGWTHDFR